MCVFHTIVPVSHAVEKLTTKGMWAGASEKAKAALKSVKKSDLAVMLANRERSMKTKKVVDKKQTQYAEAQEVVLARELGKNFEHIPGDFPTDIEAIINGVRHGVGVKTILLSGGRDRLDVSMGGMYRKAVWSRD